MTGPKTEGLQPLNSIKRAENLTYLVSVPISDKIRQALMAWASIRGIKPAVAARLLIEIGIGLRENPYKEEK